MFPLGTVLLPHTVLPLHVFEPRYQALVRNVLDGDREFGVVLIARGSEVGGGEQRTDLGCMARVVRAERLDSDRWFVVAVGARRLRVHRWLPDDPYPRAEIETFDDLEPHLDATLVQTRLLPRLRRVLALCAELGKDASSATVDPTVELSDDPEVVCWQVAALAPITAMDAQHILATVGCQQRVAALEEVLDGAEQTLKFRLHGV